MQLVNNHANGIGTVPDKVAAFYWYRRSAEVGSVIGMRKMAIALLDGSGVRKDQETGFKLLRRAAESGDKTAQFMLQQSGR